MAELNSLATLLADANLLYYWRYEGNANDEKNARNGTGSNVAYNASYGKYGQGVSFTASSNSYIDVSSIADGDKTYSFWLKTTANTGSIYTTDGTSVVYFKIVLGATGGGTGTNGKIAFGRNNGTSWSNVISNSLVNTGGWVHCVITISGTNVTIYINGVSDNTGTTHSSLTLNKTVTFGNLSWSKSTTDALTGYLDDFCIFSRVLTAAEVLQLYRDQSSSGFFALLGGL